MSRSPSLGVLLLSGCLIHNPAYDPDATGSATTTGGASTTTVTTGPVDPTTSSTGASTCRSHAECDNDQFCDGDERCDPAAADADALGCVAGVPPCDAATCSEDQDACLAGCELDPDADDDGVDAIACGGLDCDDGAPAIHPGAMEVCDPDGVDEDCDPATLGGLDADGDGQISGECCNLDGGALVCGDDCDDSLSGVGIGDWAHCSACGAGCAAQQACTDGQCVSARRVFVTSSTHAGDFGGVEAADAICQARAGEAALGGTFKAYVVQQGAGLDRLAHPQVPFVRLDGVKVADDWDDLADESLDAPIDRDEHRKPADNNAWTGLRDVDGGGVSSCNNWTSDDGACLDSFICGGAGEVTTNDDHWDGFYIFDCNKKYRLYCIEQ
jgi:hypothetical protein